MPKRRPMPRPRPMPKISQKANATAEQIAQAQARERAMAEEAAANKEAKAMAEADATAKAREAERKAAEAVEMALQLSSLDRQRLQVALIALGFDPGGSDGVFGPRTRQAIGAWQSARN